MYAHFDTVRLGKFRKDIFTERALVENVKNLKRNIRNLLESHKEGRVDMEIVIPAKGTNVKFALQNINDLEIKRILIQEFPDNVYKGRYSMLAENSNNIPVFPLMLCNELIDQ